MGDNAKAALITRGLAEIRRLGRALGANDGTFAGLAGIGGLLVLTFFVATINAIIVAVVLSTKRKSDFLKKIPLALTVVLIVVLFTGWQISNFELHKNSSAYNLKFPDSSFSYYAGD